jgi:thymidylate synthase (FAD)
MDGIVWATPNLEQIIVDCARVSTGKVGGEVPQLLAYLIKHSHWSPFEMASICVKITTSRAVSQQILRHRSFSFQEFSQRYAEVQGIEPVELRCQAKQNRQSSSDIIEDIVMNGKVERHMQSTLALYSDLLENGVAKESARLILPMCCSTVMYVCGTVRSWMHYLNLRCQIDTQKEHRELAKEIFHEFSLLYPNIFKE